MKRKIKQEKLYEDYSSVIAQGCLTNSKHPSCFVNGVYPKVLTNKDKYIDYICGLGTNLFGESQSASLPTLHEVKLAKLLNKMIGKEWKWKFLTDGSGACSAAVKIARAFTKKKWVMSEFYHGWHDQFISMTPPANGVVDNFHMIDRNDRSLMNPPMGKDFAAHIIEPVSLDYSEKRIGLLSLLRDDCDRFGSLLIYDEIITGLRFRNFSVAKDTGIYPDIIVFGKALGSGFPISAIGGRAEIMDCDYFISSTNAASKAGINQAIKNISGLLKSRDQSQLLWQMGDLLIDAFNQLYPEKIMLKGYPTRGRFEGDELTVALFFQEMVKRRFLLGKSWFFGYHHISKANLFLETSKAVLEAIQKGIVALEGELPASPFADRARKNA